MLQLHQAVGDRRNVILPCTHAGPMLEVGQVSRRLSVCLIIFMRLLTVVAVVEVLMIGLVVDA